MTRIVRSAVALIVLAACGPALHAADDDPDKKALKELTGTYTLKTLEKAGKAAPEESAKAIESVVIADGKFTITVGGEAKKAALSVSVGKRPATFDLVPESGDEKGKRFKGIYKLEKDELTVAYVEEGAAPKEFKSDGAGVTMLVLTRRAGK